MKTGRKKALMLANILVTSASLIRALSVAAYHDHAFFCGSLENEPARFRFTVFHLFGRLLLPCAASFLSWNARCTELGVMNSFQQPKERNFQGKKMRKEKLAATWCHLEIALHANKSSAFKTERGRTA